MNEPRDYRLYLIRVKSGMSGIIDQKLKDLVGVSRIEVIDAGDKPIKSERHFQDIVVRHTLIIVHSRFTGTHKEILKILEAASYLQILHRWDCYTIQEDKTSDVGISE